MTISEKNEILKKNKYIHLATITAGLALCHVSEVSSDTGYVSPRAAFLSAELCAYPIDSEVEGALAGPGGTGGARNGRNR